jgi:hypothetical protein
VDRCYHSRVRYTVMLRFSLFFTSLFLSAFASAQNWANYFDYDGHADNVAGMVTDTSGNVYVTGASYDGTTQATQTIAYNSSGRVVWQDRWTSAVGDRDVPSKLILGNDGKLYILGLRSNQASSATYVLRYALSGGAPDVGYFDADAHDEIPHGLAVDGNGDMYVCGEHGNFPPSAYIVKFDHMTMAAVWNKSYNFTYDDRAEDIVCDSIGRNYTLARSSTQAGPGRVVILKHDKDGNVVWKYFYGTANTTYQPWKLKIDTSSNCFWCGSQSTPIGYFDAVVQKVDVHGVTAWTATYDGTAHMHENLLHMVLGPQGDVFATGSVMRNNNDTAVLTLKVNASGNVAAARIAALSPNDYEVGKDICLDKANRLYVVGQGLPGPTAVGTDFYELSYDATTMALAHQGNFGGGMGVYRPVSISSVGNGHVVMAGDSDTGPGDFITFQALERPVVRNDAYLVNYGHTLTVGAAAGLLKNDIYTTGGYVFYANNFSKVTASFYADGSFTAAAKPGAFGIDSNGGYRVVRENLQSDAATITFNIVPALASLVMNPATIGFNGTSTGTVTLNHVSGSGGTTVSLLTSNGNVFLVPTSVTVPAGQSTATFQGHSNTLKGSVTVTARWNGVAKMATVTVQ